MVSMRLVRRSSTSRPARGHRLLVQGNTRVLSSSAATPGDRAEASPSAVPSPVTSTVTSPVTSTVAGRRSSGRSSSRWCTATAAIVLTAAHLAAGQVVAPPAQAAPPTVGSTSAIEAFAPYQGQVVCDPVARVGAVALRQLVLASYPGTADGGITRACTTGGVSEHKEGRAWDWRVSTSNPNQVLQVADLMTWLLAPDQHGNQAAMARRLGIMYVIWDGKVWKSYQAGRGWQPYTGASPHTDHVHFSLSWAGAYGMTSYWTGRVAPVVPGPAPLVAPPAVAPPVTSPVVPPPVGTGPVVPPVVDRAPQRPVVDRAAQRRVVPDRAPRPRRRR